MHITNLREKLEAYSTASELILSPHALREFFTKPDWLA